MKTTWHNTWGSAKGPINEFAPQSRILTGTIVFFICIVAPADTPLGIAIALFSLLFWFLLCRPSAKVIQPMTLFGLAMFAPYFLLTPMIADDSTNMVESLMVPWRIFFRGMLTLLICITTISSLTLSELRTGVSNLPIPRIVSEILLQITHQTMSMAYETKHIAHAMAVRGVTGRARTAIKLLSTLPQVWLPRVIGRAENISAAMEIRGYSEIEYTDMGMSRYRLKDFALMFFTGLLFLFTSLIRIGWCL